MFSLPAVPQSWPLKMQRCQKILVTTSWPAYYQIRHVCNHRQASSFVQGKMIRRLSLLYTSKVAHAFLLWEKISGKWLINAIITPTVEWFIYTPPPILSGMEKRWRTVVHDRCVKIQIDSCVGSWQLSLWYDKVVPAYSTCLAKVLFGSCVPAFQIRYLFLSFLSWLFPWYWNYDHSLAESDTPVALHLHNYKAISFESNGINLLIWNRWINSSCPSPKLVLSGSF